MFEEWIISVKYVIRNIIISEMRIMWITLLSLSRHSDGLRVSIK